MNRFVFAVAAVLFAVPAAAQEAFEGPYIGLQAGYIDYYDADPALNGLEYGVVVGYSAVNGRVFGGLEAEFSLSSAEVDFDDPLVGAATLSVNYSYGASLMAGYTLAPASLVYGKIGAIFTEFEADALGQTDTDTASGITFGAGSEVAIGRGFSLRGEAEYRFLELDDTDVDSLGIDFALIRRF